MIVVGTGRLGSALVGALGLAGTSALAVRGRDAAADPGVVLSAVRATDGGALVLLAIRDDALAVVARRLASSASAVPRGAVALHHSGALGVDVLAPLAATGFATGSCHPMQTFTGSAADARRFGGSTFAIDGEGEGRTAAERLARLLGGRSVSVAPSRRGLYHLAASLGANGLTGLLAASRDALVAAGLDPAEALAALGPLLRSALEEALRVGPEAALTGPVDRGDDATLERHRRAILAWDASRASLLEALLREERRLARPEREGG